MDQGVNSLAKGFETRCKKKIIIKIGIGTGNPGFQETTPFCEPVKKFKRFVLENRLYREGPIYGNPLP